MKITKAIIPAAGLGTRVLPSSKAVPKEMLNIVDKPAIQFIVEEAAVAGITDILIVTNRGKEAIENHFDYSLELEKDLAGKEKTLLLEQIQKVSHLANIYFIRQKELKGLGNAILTGKSFVGKEPFAVLYGDDVILSQKPVIGQLIQAYEKYKLGVVGVNQVQREKIHKYCSIKVEPMGEKLFKCSDMVEKPTLDEIMSLYAVLGRCVLPAEIFDILEKTPKGVGGEVQLTDAMSALAREKGMVAVDFDGKRFDLGSKLGILKANVEVGLEHPEIKAEFREYLKQIVEELDK